MTFAREGADLVLNTGSSHAELEEVAAQCRELGVRTHTAICDVSDAKGVYRMVADGTEALGKIDVLVSNVAIRPHKPILEVSEDEWQHVFAVNLDSAFYLCKAVLPGMTREGRGTIVNVGSVLGRLGTPFNSAYVSSKFAVEGLSESLRVELWPLGIRVAVVEPGAVRTNFHQNQVVSEGVEAGGFAYSSFVNRLAGRHTTQKRFP